MPIFSKFILIRSKGTRKHDIVKDYLLLSPIFKSLFTRLSYQIKTWFYIESYVFYRFSFLQFLTLMPSTPTQEGKNCGIVLGFWETKYTVLVLPAPTHTLRKRQVLEIFWFQNIFKVNCIHIINFNAKL